MAALILFVFSVVGGLLQLLIWAIIINAILSWLIAFQVINTRNQFVYSVVRFLDAVTGFVLRPVQRIVPSLGGVDISPIIVILVLQGVSSILLPSFRNFLLATLA